MEAFTQTSDNHYSVVLEGRFRRLQPGPHTSGQKHGSVCGGGGVPSSEVGAEVRGGPTLSVEGCVKGKAPSTGYLLSPSHSLAFTMLPLFKLKKKIINYCPVNMSPSKKLLTRHHSRKCVQETTSPQLHF